MDKQTPRWAFFSMGLSISAVQGLLIRLLLVGFSGNELAIGLILGNWMLAEAMGSYLGGRLARRLRDISASFVLLQILFALLLPVVVAGGYLVRQLVAAVPGEALDLVTMAWAALIVLFPLSCIHGAMFSLGAATHARSADSEPRITGQLYALEALGAMCGGVILTFLLIPRQQPIQSALLVAILGFVSAGCLAKPRLRLPRRQGLVVLVATACALCLFLLITSRASNLHRSLVGTRWGSAHEVVYERDSPYGNIAVSRLLGQYTVLANGVPYVTAPFPDILTVEEVVHLPLLFHPDPRRVLLIGAGLGGVSSELLKYPVECVDYAELDPALIEAVRALPTELTRSELSNERLHVHGIDGRLWLHRLALGVTKQRPYDIVLVNLPYPATLEINRFYTQEFLRLVQVVLDDRGLVVFKLPGSLTYVGPGLRDLNASLLQGLRASFTHVRPIPGDTALWLASPSLPLTEVPVDQLVATWQQRTPPTRFLTEDYLRLKLDLQRLEWFQAALSRQRELPLNRDLRPSGVLLGLAYWSEMFAPATSRLLTAASRVELWQWCLVPIVLSVALCVAVRTAHGSVEHVIPAVVAATGFSGMVCDLTVVFAFQVLFGYVYQQVALIVGVFMAGLALGGWMATRRDLNRLTAWRALLVSEIAIIAFWVAMPAWLQTLGSGTPTTRVTPTLLAANALGGWLVGLQFPLSYQLHLSGQGEVSRSAGVLYAADLVGAFMGAVAVGITLLPALGTMGTGVFVATLKTCSLLLLLVSSRTHAAQTPGIARPQNPHLPPTIS